MTRYFAISTAIVITVCLAILAIPYHSESDRAAQPYASATGTPGPPQQDPAEIVPLPVRGDAPWALSALPECFRQVSSAGGSPAFAHAAMPRRARRLPQDVTLRVADCTLQIRAASALVSRGENRLVVPAVAHFYVAGGRLVLDRLAAGREEVRVYEVRGAAPLVLPLPSSKP